MVECADTRKFIHLSLTYVLGARTSRRTVGQSCLMICWVLGVRFLRSLRILGKRKWDKGNYTTDKLCQCGMTLPVRDNGGLAVSLDASSVYHRQTEQATSWGNTRLRSEDAWHGKKLTNMESPNASVNKAHSKLVRQWMTTRMCLFRKTPWQRRAILPLNMTLHLLFNGHEEGWLLLRHLPFKEPHCSGSYGNHKHMLTYHLPCVRCHTLSTFCDQGTNFSLHYFVKAWRSPRHWETTYERCLHIPISSQIFSLCLSLFKITYCYALADPLTEEFPFVPHEQPCRN